MRNGKPKQNDTEKTKSIRIRVVTKATLQKMAHPGQSIDGVITELLDKLELIDAMAMEPKNGRPL